jgi:HK97 family phage major capsid protein
MSGNDNLGGGVMVPSELATQVIDYARNVSAVWQAGAVTIPMDSDTLTIARQIADPTIEVKGQNEAFTLAGMQFDAINFTAYKIGAVIVMSRELAADAPNAAEVVSTALSKALAVEVDRFALEGSGSVEPSGLINLAGIGTTGSVGAIAWEDIHGAVVNIKALNHTPNAYILDPVIAGDLDIITSGDGSTSAKLWLGPPPSVAPLARFETNNCTITQGMVGDFTKLLIGMRQIAAIEVSTEAGDFFAKHQLGIKITFRFDVNCSHPAAFHSLTGITT